LPQSRSSADRAGCWFLRSGIQEPTGGVARYYHTDTGRNARVSTEITGYAVSALVYLHTCRGDEGYLQAATKSGEFLCRTAWNEELQTFPFEHSGQPGDALESFAYFFDCGIIVRGLLALWRKTGQGELLDVAGKAGVSMHADFAAAHLFHPILRLPTKEPLAYEPRWSRSPGCYQLKSALAWHDLFEATGHGAFEDWYEAAVASAIDSHGSFLPAETPEKTMDRLHAFCYFLEALLPLVHRSEVLAVVAQGIDAVSRYLRSLEAVFVRSDVYAQLLRVRLLASQLGGLDLNVQEAAEEAKMMQTFQFESEDKRVKGGFWFGRNSAGLLPYVNPVSTAFCLQALEMWQEYNANKLLDRSSLI
jgi:hypothetical protein